ncbi:MAG: hypothetical protein ABWY93_22890 [Mycobacterium sp.]
MVDQFGDGMAHLVEVGLAKVAKYGLVLQAQRGSGGGRDSVPSRYLTKHLN